MALRPPSVTQAAPSGPTITPCGAEPAPRATRFTSLVAGLSQPSSPVRWPVYQTPPSRAGATSCGADPAGTVNTSTASALAGFGVAVGLASSVAVATEVGATAVVALTAPAGAADSSGDAGAPEPQAPKTSAVSVSPPAAARRHTSAPDDRRAIDVGVARDEVRGGLRGGLKGLALHGPEVVEEHVQRHRGLARCGHDLVDVRSRVLDWRDLAEVDRVLLRLPHVGKARPRAVIEALKVPLELLALH